MKSYSIRKFPPSFLLRDKGIANCAGKTFNSQRQGTSGMVTFNPFREAVLIRLILPVLFVMTAATAAFADWRLYKENDSVVASFVYLSFAPFHGQLSVRVRWH
jgi:hypothetical protein